MDLRGYSVCGGLLLLMLARVQGRGTLQVFIAWLVDLRAAVLAVQDFIRAGRERVSARWTEHLARARAEV